MLSSKLIKIIKILLYALVLTPIIITPMTIFPFNFGRGLIIQFLIEIIFGLYLILAIFDKNYRPKKNILTVLFGLFLAILFISSLFGADFKSSFWSNHERFTGWFYLLHVFAVFIIMASVFKIDAEWKSFLKFNAIVSIPMFAVAILSLFGVKFWGVDLGTRISGTLGNPIFLAAYFILNLIAALCLFFIENGKKFRIIWLLIGVMLAAGIFLTQSRGAVLGITGGIIAGLIFYGIINAHRKTKQAVLLAILAIVAGIFLLGLFRDSNLIKKSATLSRLTHISLASGTGYTRLIGWKAAQRAIIEKPILGWGMEKFDVAFNEYYNPELLKYSYYETWFDKPHNKILEVAVDGGIVGVALYLSIFAAAVFFLKKKAQNGELPLSAASVLTGGLAGYFIQNLFAFDTIVSYLIFFILLAFIGYQKNASIMESKKIPIFLFLPVMAIISISAFIMNLSPLLASADLRNVVAIPFAAGQKINLAEYQRAMRRFNPYQSEWRVDAAKSVISDMRTERDIYTDEERAYILKELEKNTAEFPNDAYGHMFLGGFYAELGKEDKKYFELAKNELDRALELSPKRQHIYFTIARMYSLMGDKDNVIKISKQMINLKPDVAVSYWEAGKHLYFSDKENPLVREWITRAAELGYAAENHDEFLFLFKIAYNYILESKNYRVLSDFYERMQFIEPKEAKWYAQRATVEYMLGHKKSAVKDIMKAIAVDDGYKQEGEAFIRLIQGE